MKSFDRKQIKQIKWICEIQLYAKRGYNTSHALNNFMITKLVMIDIEDMKDLTCCEGLHGFHHPQC